MRRTLAIVGRPNVGKSALFNKLVGKPISLVFDQPGVTRDRVMAEIKLGGFPCTLIDTGGIGLEDASGFEDAIRHEVDLALASATDIILVMDGREGLGVVDKEVADLLRRGKIPVTVAINKMDHENLGDIRDEFGKLGLGRLVPISCAHGRGIGALVEEVTKYWEKEEETEIVTAKEKPVRIALVGRPNVGKSSIINRLLGQERLIVSPVAGTTRDAVDIEFEYKGSRYSLVDTAGLRKKARIDDPLEQAMTGRTAHSINSADICILVLDAERGPGVQDKKIAGLIQQAQRPCVVLVNKWDLVEEAIPDIKGEAGQKKRKEFRQQYQEGIQRELFFVHYAPVVFASAKKAGGLGELMAAIQRVDQQRQIHMPTGVLNRILREAQERQPSPRQGGRGLKFKLYYATQLREDKTGVPAILLFVNNPELWSENYGKFLEQKIRDHFGLEGCPLKWELRARESREENSPPEGTARKAGASKQSE